MECQKLLVEDATVYDMVLDGGGQVNPGLPWDLEDQLYEGWRDRSTFSRWGLVSGVPYQRRRISTSDRGGRQDSRARQKAWGRRTPT